MAEHREWKEKIIIIQNNRSVAFHIDQFQADCTEMNSLLYILVWKMGSLNFLT